MTTDEKIAIIIDCLLEIMDNGTREEFVEDYENGHRYEIVRGINIDNDVMNRLIALEEEFCNAPEA